MQSPDRRVIEVGAFRPTEQVEDGVNAMLDEVHKWASALRGLRDEQAAERALQAAAF